MSKHYIFKSFQFDQSDLLLPSSEYYLLGLGHPIMQTYYNLLVNVATLLGAERNRAKREMKELIEFEIELASVSWVVRYASFFVFGFCKIKTRHSKTCFLIDVRSYLIG